ncbi:unnamed protein product [Bathycoccus prasinos]
MNQARQYSQKPGAIRERTRMTDTETKWRKDRARLLEKYKLSLAEINVVRADAGLPELDRPYRVNAFAGMMAINAETERLQGEVLEQMNLTQNLRDDVRGLDQRMKQMVVEEQGRRVVVPAENNLLWRQFTTTFGCLLFKPDLDWLNSFNVKAKLATSAYLAEKTKYTIPFNFTQIRELFEDRFGKNTDPYTYISIYGEAPSRDDWGLVMINPPPMDGQKEKKMNYIVLNA